MSPLIDLRSDTVTRPSPPMRRAMAEAEVGDDVYGEDPTVRRLEATVAALLGKEAALFVPSGTMANQLALRSHTEPGDEAIIEATGHSYAYETGAMAGLSGVQARPLRGDRGLLDPADVERAVSPVSSHFARTRIILIENTSNRGGGTPYTLDRIAAIADIAERHRLALHMDGARLWNAHVATGIPLATYAARATSVSVCLSKGLGAPVGSVLAGTRVFIERAHRFRKMFGGGMRQAGILAAAGLWAIEHNVPRLAEDHQHLKRLAEGLAAIPGLRTDASRYETNIAYATVTRPGLSAAAVVERLKDAGVLVNATSPDELRFVTHLDVDAPMIEAAIARVRRALAE
ncbi:MAG: low-specificity L-threonine aldolase [Deltaproteobacteria bacterium]|nr:low-specificity L-threonine aldolase [Deltaproteobacteria bacterium]